MYMKNSKWAWDPILKRTKEKKCSQVSHVLKNRIAQIPCIVHVHVLIGSQIEEEKKR